MSSKREMIMYCIYVYVLYYLFILITVTKAFGPVIPSVAVNSCKSECGGLNSRLFSSPFSANRNDALIKVWVEEAEDGLAGLAQLSLECKCLGGYIYLN